MGPLYTICERTIRSRGVRLEARLSSLRLDASKLLGEEVILLCGLNN